MLFFCHFSAHHAIFFMVKFGEDVLKQPRPEGGTEYSRDLESRLQAAIEKHRDLVLSFSADLEYSRKQMISHLIKEINHLDTCKGHQMSSIPFVKLASIDVEWSDVRTLLCGLSGDRRFSSFFEASMGKSNNISEQLTNIETGESRRFILKTHVTMAYFKDMSQSELRTAFEPLVGLKVTIVITAFIWSKRNAAFAIRLPATTDSGILLPSCKNKFPHITIWHHEGTSAAESNNLPNLLATNEAQIIEFESTKEIQGVIQLWDSSNSVISSAIK
jgi:Fungal tRNA ligase phosphodiesterase domain